MDEGHFAPRFARAPSRASAPAIVKVNESSPVKVNATINLNNHLLTLTAVNHIR